MFTNPITSHLGLILFAFASWCLPSGAGVIISGGKIESASLTLNSSTIDVTFVESSWDGLTSDQRLAIQQSSWWDNNAAITSLEGQLRDAIQAAHTQITIRTINLFAGEPLSASDLGNNITVGAGGVYTTTTAPPWPVWNTSTFKFDNTGSPVFSTAGTTGFFGNYAWAVPTAGDNTVPEPSTAIAMGLLGIVGFAGNRRRRRQASVA